MDDPMMGPAKGLGQAEPEVQGPKPILMLSQDVINQIAAAEIIHRPSNAIKELIENSLDAGSTSIKVTIKEGGMKMFSVGDNGCGIRKQDLPHLFTRYSTSKLRTFSDLSSIQTYGFRGEALASISYVCRSVGVVTKVRGEGCGWKASYLEGKLAPNTPGNSTVDPRPSAANDGTIIIAEDLFFNSPIRRKAFKSPTEEFNRIMDVVTRYAVHNPTVAWVCKKATSNIPELSTPSNSTVQQNISLLFGSSLGRELLEVKAKSVPELGVEKVEGWVTNANWNQKRYTFLLFINHRLVESSKIKKAIETLYQAYLPKNTSPYVYMSLEIDPSRCDVNVHPTKQEVHFLDEDAVIEAVVQEVANTLSNANASRTFSVQTLLPGARDPKVASETAPDRPTPSSYKPAPKQKVRIDPSERTLESMDMFAKRNPDQVESSHRPSKRRRLSQGVEDVVDLDDDDDEQSVMEQEEEDDVQNTAGEKFAPIQESDVALKSVKKLRAAVKRAERRELTSVIQKHTFIGIMQDRALALFQSGTKLYLASYDRLSDALFYQLGLRQFGALSKMKLEPPPSLETLLKIALENEPGAEDAGFNLTEVLQTATDKLYSRRDMLDEYFSFTISEKGNIENLPMLLHDFTPDLDRLPFFLLAAGLRVDWTDESKCFDGFLRELANFYSPIPTEPLDTNAESTEDDMIAEDLEEMKEQQAYQKHQIQHVLFPAMKKYASLPKELSDKGYVKEIANLPDLYRIFERC